MGATQAIVIGGSIAGMCTARVLSDYCDRVIVIDRDSYPTGPQERAGVPQSRHVHALLARGRGELERLFPGFDRAMVEQGAHEIDFGMDFATLRPQGWAPRQSDGLQLLFASRNLLESVVRGLCRRHANIEFMERTTVTSLLASNSSGLRVTGVRVASQDEGAPSSLDADLVVDASGRNSKSPEWLQELGLSMPEETVVNSHTGYSSRWFALPEPSRWPREWWWKGVWIDIAPPDNMTAGVLFPVEHNRCIVTLAGVNKQYPPNDDDGFMRAVDNLRSPVIGKVLRLAEPLSTVYSYRTMANRIRHYDRWKERLAGFIALGDSTCAFNPIYGQGMTTGTLAAGVLGECVKKVGLTNGDIPQMFFGAQARMQQDPWLLATGADFRFPGTEGVRSKSAGLIDPYMLTLMSLSDDDPVLKRRVGEVINMLRPPSALFAPSIIGRVAWCSLQRRLTGSARLSQEVSAMPPALASVG
ncbi:MAG: FAD-binding protein [Deltaproteobacteria bacterium]|nr:FAD-binding protein [Deltaproteobacteria bacterium]